MANNLSNYGENNLIEHLFRNASFDKPDVLAIALLTAEPPEDSTGEFSLSGDIEVSGGSYARQLCSPDDSTWSEPSDGVTTNSVAFTFPTASSDWGTLTHIAICTSETVDDGEMIAYGALSSPKTILNGDTFVLHAGSFTVTFT